MGVARVKTVTKARKDQGVCGGCDKELRKGDPYRWWTVGFRSRFKNKRCMDCPLPPPSARESNPKIATILAVGEDFDLDAVSDRDGFVSALETAANGIRDAAEMWNESADALEEGFQHETSQSEEQREKGEAAESWAEALDDAANSLDEERGEDETEAEYIDRLREEAQSAFDDNQMDY
jgi:hypothetical protein